MTVESMKMETKITVPPELHGREVASLIAPLRTPLKLNYPVLKFSEHAAHPAAHWVKDQLHDIGNMVVNHPLLRSPVSKEQRKSKSSGGKTSPQAESARDSSADPPPHS